MYPSDDSPQATAWCVEHMNEIQCIRATIPRKPQRAARAVRLAVECIRAVIRCEQGRLAKDSGSIRGIVIFDRVLAA